MFMDGTNYSLGKIHVSKWIWYGHLDPGSEPRQGLCRIWARSLVCPVPAQSVQCLGPTHIMCPVKSRTGNHGPNGPWAIWCDQGLCMGKARLGPVWELTGLALACTNPLVPMVSQTNPNRVHDVSQRKCSSVVSNPGLKSDPKFKLRQPTT